MGIFFFLQIIIYMRTCIQFCIRLIAIAIHNMFLSRDRL